jgi:hypothetical protein
MAEVMFRSALPRLGDHEPMGARMPPADGPHAGDQAKPVREQDQDEDRGEEPKGLLDQFGTHDALQQPVQALDQPLPKILRAIGHGPDLPRGIAGEQDQAEGDHPGHHHGIRHRQRPKLEQRHGGLGQAVVLPVVGRQAGQRPREEEGQDGQDACQCSHGFRVLKHHRRTSGGCVGRTGCRTRGATTRFFSGSTGTAMHPLVGGSRRWLALTAVRGYGRSRGGVIGLAWLG